MEFNKTDDLLKFWIEVDLFRGESEIDGNNIPDESDVRARAQEILYRYFTPEHREGNDAFQAYTVDAVVGAETKNEIRRAIQGGGSLQDSLSGVFDEAQDAVYARMEEKEYQLFLNSSQCKDLISMIRTQEVVFERLIEG